MTIEETVTPRPQASRCRCRACLRWLWESCNRADVSFVGAFLSGSWQEKSTKTVRSVINPRNILDLCYAFYKRRVLERKNYEWRNIRHRERQTRIREQPVKTRHKFLPSPYSLLIIFSHYYFHALPEKTKECLFTESSKVDVERCADEEEWRRMNEILHLEPVTYLFCKDAFCTNNKAAIR